MIRIRQKSKNKINLFVRLYVQKHVDIDKTTPSPPALSVVWGSRTSVSMVLMPVLARRFSQMLAAIVFTSTCLATAPGQPAQTGGDKILIFLQESKAKVCGLPFFKNIFSVPYVKVHCFKIKGTIYMIYRSRITCSILKTYSNL